MSNRSRTALSSGLLVALFVGFCVHLVARPPGAAGPGAVAYGGGALAAVEGTVERRTGSGAWTQALPGDRLQRGDALRTGPGGRAEVILAEPPGRLRLDAASEIHLRGPSRSLLAGAHVLSGSVWSDVSLGRTGIRFRLWGGGVTADAAGATVRLERLPDAAVLISVYDGTARVAGGRAGVTGRHTVAAGRAALCPAIGDPLIRDIDRGTVVEPGRTMASRVGPKRPEAAGRGRDARRTTQRANTG
jgi:hypothetical protein